MAPSRQRNGTTGGKKNLTVSCDETKQRLPEEDHSPITSARSNDWAECRNKKVSAPSRRRDMSLDISFYRTSPVRLIGRSRPAADASREANRAVVACWLR